MKIFKRSVWVMLTIFFALLFAISIVGQMIMDSYSGWIHDFFGTSPTDIVVEENVDPNVDTEYFKSDAVYLNAAGDPVVVKDENGVRHQIYDHAAMRKYSMDVSERVVEEGSVLLWNNNNALPLSKENKVSLFGITAMSWLFSGYGSGNVVVGLKEDFRDVLMNRGLSVNPELYAAYRLAQQGHGRRNNTRDAAVESGKVVETVDFTIGEVSWTDLVAAQPSVTSQLSAYGDAAIYAISRNGSEDGETNFYTEECLDNNYLDLSKDEQTILENLDRLKDEGVFKKVILLLDCAVPLRFSHIREYDIDACLWVGIGGNASLNGTADLLVGNANPSGHLTDTWAYNPYSAPATVNFGDLTYTESAGVPGNKKYCGSTKYIAYAEGIYVGYRYYETRYEDSVIGGRNANSEKGVVEGSGNWAYGDEVLRTFGYGGSYTTFAWTDLGVNETADNYEVSVTVKNTGAVAGKDVVEIYLQKPYTDYDREKGIEKAAAELVGFEKTSLLQPGKSETVTVTVPKYELKSYDAYGARTYIVEAGDYYLTAGTDAHNAVNNILAAKGYTKSDGMDEDGNTALVHKLTVEASDRFSTSPFTGKAVTNQFDNADVNLYEGTEGQHVTYLSRKDWGATYPTAATVLTCTSERMLYDMQYGHTVAANEGDEMPLYGTVTSEFGALTLAMLMEFDYDDPMWEDLLNQLTWEESVMLVTLGSQRISGAESIAAPGFLASDGPVGFRKKIPEGLDTLMCFPCNPLQASTFNVALIEEVGNAFGMELLHVGYTGIYGTGANIHRCAYSGRNWEYFSEDGLLSGKMFSAECTGLQNRGVVAFTKHFVLNDQETNRYGISVWANEQAIREVYLKGFEAGITEGHSRALMTSFNRIGCTWSGTHKGLLTDILRNEWGFVGFTITDAAVGAHMLDKNAMAAAVIAGQDNWLSGGNVHAYDEYANNPTVCQAIRTACHRVLYVMLHSSAMNGFTVNTHVHNVTTWWQATVIGLEAAFGALLCVCLTMAGLSFIFAARKKLNHNSEEKS